MSSGWNTHDEDFVVDDKTRSKAQDAKQELTPRQLMALVLLLGGGLMGFFLMGHNLLGGLLLGAWAAAQAHGWKTLKATRDKTRKVKDYDRPMAFRGATLGLIGGADFFLYTKHPVSLIRPEAFAHSTLVMLVATMVAVVWTFFGNWKQVFKKAKSVFVKEPELTEDGLLLQEFSEDTLPKAGLSTVGMDTGLEIKPVIVEKHLDKLGRATVLVEPVVGQQSFGDYLYRKDKIADAWGVRDLRLTTKFDKENKRRVITITALASEAALGDVEHWKPLSVIPEDIVEYVQKLPMGVLYYDGGPWYLDLARRNFVVGGRPGSGKSSFANSLLAHLVLHPAVRVMFIDLKNGVEAAQWQGHISDTIDNSTPDGIRSVNSFLDLALDDLQYRYAEMGKYPAVDAKGAPIIDPETGKQKIGITNVYNCKGFLSPERPLKVIVIDESSDLFGDEATREEKRALREKLKKFIQQGRAGGYILIMATQTPTEENIPRIIRSAASDKLAFGMDAAAVLPTLGLDYSISKGEDPTSLGIGEMIIRNKENNQGLRIKTLFIDDADKPQIVANSVIGGTSWLYPQFATTWVKFRKYLTTVGAKESQSRAARLEAEIEAKLRKAEEADDTPLRLTKRGSSKIIQPIELDDDDFDWND